MFNINILLEYFKIITKDIELSDNMVMQHSPGHTREAAKFACCGNGRDTATYYAIATYLNLMDEEQGLAMLSEIEKLMDTDPQSATYGCSRWYREESQVIDTNGAFFVLRPLVFTLIWCENKLSKLHKEKILQLLNTAYEWFVHELKNPILYYSNKIMSDGAILLAISHFLQKPEGIEKSMRFWRNWLKYTETRGWGWGENISVCYSQIILDALNYVLQTMEDIQTREQLVQIKNNLLSCIRFHGGYEFVPSIRTYNLDGNCMNQSVINVAGGVRFCKEEICNDMNTFFSFIIETEVSGITTADITDKLQEPDKISIAERTEHIFDESYSYTWVGSNLRMGSINHFPVMPGSYQNRGWGLGWQSMPVSFLVYRHQLSFLRFSVHEGNNHRTHIAHNKHEAYLNNALFSEDNIPDVYTMCAQRQNALLVIRSMEHLANSAKFIEDEWYIQNFGGEVEEINLAQKWVVLKYDTCAVAICPLDGIDYSSDNRGYISMQQTKFQNNLQLSQNLYAGEEKFLYKKRLESAWAVVCLDNPDNIIKQLSAITIRDENVTDIEVPRDGYTQLRKITYQDKDKTFSLLFDPHLKKSIH